MGNWCGSVAAASVLDQVISQASNEDECLLYRLANYKKGGELIDAYNVGGSAEVERLIKDQFGILLYNDGKGQTINRAEYLRWKFRDIHQVALPIEASLSPHDPLAKWTDHEACWQMQYRGSLGETLLHVLIICDTKVHTRLARILLKCFPHLALDVVEGEEYLGASALHLAIAYFNNELVQDLVEAGANVNQRAIGSFFLPRDQQRQRPARHTDYEGLAYLGEYPLSWAACCANESVYNLLLESDAHPDMRDSFGNMILHMVVVCDKLDMFGYALRHPRLPASNGIANHAGLTPLTLACKLGRAEVFREMLELSAREFWRYSNITCSAYPLNALDTLLPDGRTNWNSALFIILNGTKEEHLDMLDGGIIQRLLEEKWKTFARRQFLKRLAILALHLLTMSVAVYLRPDDRDQTLLEGRDWQSYTRYGFELGTIAGVLSYIVVQQGGEIKNQGLFSFLKQLAGNPAKTIFLASNLGILACIPFRITGDVHTEEAILVFSVPGSWFLLMFFAGAIRLTGPFVTMVYSMITGDMLTFGIIYSVVLFGFSQSFYFLYKGFPGVKNTLYSSYPSTWMALFQITLGDYNCYSICTINIDFYLCSVYTSPSFNIIICIDFYACSVYTSSSFNIISCIDFYACSVYTSLSFSINSSKCRTTCPSTSGAIRLTGPFVTMVYSMITGDMLTFGIIYSVVLFGFSQSFYFLYKGFPGVKNTLYSSYPSTWMALFQITLGDYNYAELANTTYPALSKAVFLIFMVLVPILLLNMLIAMMGNTYAHVIEQSEKEWVKQWAKIVVSLERAVNQNDAQQYLQEYSIKLGPGDDPSTEQRGVMVIKSKSKTRAKQRKGALSNWKRVGKVTINELRKRGMTGEQLRRIMWGRASISTPLKISKKKKLEPYESNPLANLMTDMVPPPEDIKPAASAAVGGGFGALTAALDVMAFTNDLDINVPSAYSVADSGPPAEDPFLELFLTAEQEAIDAAHLAALAEKAVAAAITELVPVKVPEPPPVDPVLLEAQATLEQAAALEPSDSDGLGDGPLLGRGSRVKRVRSAHQRAAAQSSDRQLLFRRHQGSNSSSNTSSLDYDLVPASLLRLTSPPQGKPIKSPRSASAVQPTKSRPRPKTARANRVAPALDVPSRRGASATSAASPPPPQSPPDPLEPWSTRGITNMNTILAWPQTEEDNSL